MVSYDEAHDNVELLEAFRTLYKGQAVNLEGALRLAALAGITGRVQTVRAMGHLALGGTAEKLRSALLEYSKGESICRAGQYPGALGIEGLARGIYEVGAHVAPDSETS